MRKRLNIFITDETLALVRDLADKTGLSQGAIGTLAVTAGLESIKMAVDPTWRARFEEALKNDPDAFRKLVQGKVKGA